MGQMEMKCIFDIGKNISILAKVTQVSNVAHGPLVLLLVYTWSICPSVCHSKTNFVDRSPHWMKILN
jgi:uncharacterized protein YdgA (DUF945 family)